MIHLLILRDGAVVLSDDSGRRVELQVVGRDVVQLEEILAESGADFDSDDEI